MSNQATNIKKLREVIYNVLGKEIGKKDVCLIDLPNYYNPGDQLIREGEEQFIKQLGVDIKYRASLYFFNPRMVSKEDCILLQGGGNFGDLYYKHQKFREYIVKTFPKNKVIILPSTIHFSDINNLRKCIKAYSQHPDLVICARDNKSFKITQDNFLNNKSHLIPDMAFAIENLKKDNRNITYNRSLFLSRRDKEKSNFVEKDSLDFIHNLEVHDWPTYNYLPIKALLHYSSIYINRVLLKTLKLIGLHWNQRNDIYGFIQLHSRERQIRSAVNFTSQYNLVITTRLHGHILACILGIPNILLDDAYGKNKNWFDTWMLRNSLNAHYACSTKDVEEILVKNFTRLLNKS